MTIEIMRTTGLDPRSLALRTDMDAETHLRLQTGEKQVESISMYAAIGHTPIPLSGPCVAMDVPCFVKVL